MEIIETEKKEEEEANVFFKSKISPKFYLSKCTIFKLQSQVPVTVENNCFSKLSLVNVRPSDAMLNILAASVTRHVNVNLSSDWLLFCFGLGCQI